MIRVVRWTSRLGDKWFVQVDRLTLRAVVIAVLVAFSVLYNVGVMVGR